MFKNIDLTENFFRIMSDSRNISYKSYDKENSRCKFFPYSAEPLIIDEVTQEEFDLFYELGTAIKDGDVEAIATVVEKFSIEIVDAKYLARCFTLAKYMGRDNTKLVAETISNYVNAAGGYNQLAQLMGNDHPTLQSNKMQMFIRFCHVMAAKPYYDDRNKWAGDFAKKVITLY